MLTDPTARPDTIAPDFSNLVVVIAQTGDEWSTTGRLVHIGNPGYQNMLSSSWLTASLGGYKLSRSGELWSR